jgi:ubiquinone/menaquinone biosynthesis C-methylase UbiE
MSFYSRFVLPPLLNLVMQQKMLRERREAVVPQASGTVLEVGIGSGLNLPYYGSGVERLYGVDPSADLLAMAEKNALRTGRAIELFRESAEQLPLASDSVDTVVMTWTLCSIDDPLAALREMKRVLRHGGRLLFVEHGHAPEPSVARWQTRLTPLWKRVSGGCHLDRRIDSLIVSAGFEVAELHGEYLEGPRPFTYTYQGIAR